MKKTQPLLKTQIGIFIECMKYPDTTQYNIPSITRLTDEVEENRLINAVSAIYRERPELRIRFVVDKNGTPLQYVSDNTYLDVKRKTMTDAELSEYINEGFVKPFDLIGDEPLFRVEIIKTKTGRFLLIDVHHIIMDGFSLEYLFLKRDMRAAYLGDQLEEYEFGMLEAAGKETRSGRAYERDRQYYIDKFAGKTLATLSYGAASQIGRLIRESEYVSVETMDSWCKEWNLPVDGLFQAAFSHVLAAFTHSDHVAYTMAVHGRFDKSIRNAYGMYVHTLPVEAVEKEDLTAAGFIKACTKEKMMAIRHHSWPFTDFCSELKVSPGIGFNYLAMEEAEEKLYLGDIVLPLNQIDPLSVFSDMTVSVYRVDKKYEIRLTSSDRLYDRDLLKTFAIAMKDTLANMMGNPHGLLRDISVISKEKEKDLCRISAGEIIPYEKDKTWVDLVVRAAGRYPDHKAVVDEWGSLTYRELDEYSDRLAAYLLDQGVKINDFVAVNMDRRKEFLVAVLAVMKAGGAYIPVDPAYPEERIHYMLTDSKARLVLTREEVDLALRDYEGAGQVNLTLPDHYAYLIYTSGSTGRPKGVIQSHRSLFSFVSWRTEKLGIRHGANYGQYNSFSFDGSLDDLMCPLAVGATVTVLGEEVRNSLVAISDYITRHKITGMTVPTRFGMELIRYNPHLGLEYLMMGGEKLAPVGETSFKVINGYGPTEFTVCSSYHLVSPGEDDIPIGRPVPNTASYILDQHANPLPVGIVGEICLAGPQLSAGYINQPELTAKVFTELKIGGQKVKIYRTGDFGRYNKEGELVYAGRIDSQVKLRGYRVEMGEIENQAMVHPAVSKAVALIKHDQIVLYYTTKEMQGEEERKETENMLFDHLSETLAAYMLPRAFVWVQDFPLTSGGKIDSDKLPEPALTETLMEAPSDGLEKELFDIAASILETDRFGVTDNLIGLGFSSITMMRFAAEISDRLSLTVSVSEMIKKPFIRRIAADILTNRGQGDHVGEDITLEGIHRRGMQDYYPLTQNQRGVYIDWEMNRDTTQYNTPSVHIFADKDPKRLAEAVEKTLDAHGYLKTRFVLRKREIVSEDGRLSDLEQVMQMPCFDDKVTVPVQALDVEPDQAFFQKLVRPFDLFADRLCRFGIYTYENKTYLFIDIHHIIFDGLSNGLFMKEVVSAYDGKDLQEEDITALDYALYEEAFLKTREAAKIEEYFDQLVKGADQTEFPESRYSDLREGDKKVIQTVRSAIKKDLVDEFCKMNNVTAGSFLQSAFAEVLKSLTRADRPFYVTISNGRSADVNLLNTMGMFVKTLPVVYGSDRAEKQDEPVADYVKNMHNQLSTTYGREIYPYTHLVEKHKLYAQIMFAYQGGIQETEGSASYETMELALDTTKLPVMVNAYPEGDSYIVSVDYDGYRYNKTDMETLVKTITTVALSMTQSIVMGQVSLVDEKQKRDLVTLGRGKEVPVNPEETIVSIFRDRAKKTSNAIGVVFKDVRLTYGQIDELTDRLALYMKKEYKIGNGDIVGVMIRRSQWLLLYPLAIMKTGAAYMALDPDFPAERLGMMCEDAGARLILSEKDLPEKLKSVYQGSVFVTDQMNELPLWKEEDKKLIPGPAQEDRLLVLYTSGSTGLPKGVALTHKGVVNFCHWYVKESRMGEDDRVTAYANFGFDGHLLDMYPAVLAGARLYIFDDEIRMDLFAMNQYMVKNKITVAFFTTQISSLMKDMKNNLRCMFTGGESMPALDAPAYHFYNGYGPSECTIYSSCYEVKGRFEDNYIGRPLDNYQFYIVDSRLRLLPRGAAGELLVGGVGVGQGYINRPKLTAEKFIDYEGEKVYRSADLVRWAENDQLEFLGRIDNQVKLRGNRIELGEIENRVIEMEGISQTVAAVKGRQKNQLVCYYVADREIGFEEFKNTLSKTLTDFMIPGFYIRLPEIPFTVNGKVDRKALPEPQIESAAGYIAPESELEVAVAKAIQRVLGIGEDVGLLDSFYALGGDSIKAIRMVSDLRQNHIELKASDIMKNKTVKDIAAAATIVEEAAVKDQNPITGLVPDSAIFAYFNELHLPEKAHFNQAVLLKLTGPCDKDILQKAVNAVTYHHDMLRAFVKEGQLHIALADKEVHIREYSVKEEDEISRICASIQAGLDLGEALVRFVLFDLKGSRYLFIVAHHLIIDGVSWRILLSDLEKAYYSLKEEGRAELPAKTSNYRDYCHALRKYRDSYALFMEKAYWENLQKKLAGLPGSKEDTGRVMGQVTRELDNLETEDFLTTNLVAAGVTVEDILITALVRSYWNLTGEKAVSVQLEGHGREKITEDLQLDRTIGWFTSVYPVVFENIGGSPLQDLLTVKEIVHQIPNKGAGYPVLRYLTQDQSVFAMEKTARIGFNYLGDMTSEIKGGDLFEVDTSIDIGPSIDPANVFGPDLSVNSSVANGRFSLTFDYNKDCIEDDQAGLFVSGMIAQMLKLKQVVDDIREPVITASDLGEYQWTMEEFQRVSGDFASRGETIDRIYPLLPMQEGMLLEHLRDPAGWAYRLVNIFELDCLPEESQLNAAVKRLGEKHEVLRTAIIHEGVSVPRQAIIVRDLTVETLDFSGLPDPFAAVKKLREDILTDGYDLQKKPLYRIVCVKKTGNSCYLLEITHHIIVDGWCIDTYRNDFFRYLADEILGQPAKEEPVSKRRYETAVREILQKDKREALDYYKTLLEDYDSRVEISSYGNVPLKEQSDTDVLYVSLDEETTARFMELCQEEQATVNNGVELAWGLVLGTCSRRDDAVFAKVVSGRDNTREDVSDLVGLFINSVPVRVKTGKDDTLRTMLKKLQKQAAETNSRDYCPLADIQQMSQLGMQLISSIFVFENYSSDLKGDIDLNLPFHVTTLLLREEVFDEVQPSAFIMDDKLYLRLIFNKNHYRKAEIERILDLFRMLIIGMTNMPDEPLVSLPLLSDENLAKVMAMSTGPKTDYHLEQTWLDMFLNHARKQPDHLAVEDHLGSYSYRQLDHASDQLAAYLIDQGVKPDDFVIIKMHRFKEFAVAVIGIQKAGACYIPIDPNYPKDRIDYMMEDSKAQLVLDERIIRDIVEKRPAAAPVNLAGPDNLAYMIYTSGSTGKPKGAMIPHRALKNYTEFYVRRFDVTPDDRISHHITFSFDSHIRDFYPALAAGASLHFMPDDIVMEPDEIYAFLEEKKITGSAYATAMGLMMINHYDLKQRFISIGGETIPGIRTGNIRIFNVCGATEVTDVVVDYELEKETYYDSVPVGRPMANSYAFILDEHDRLLPRGVAGEICYAGPNVGKGYWNKTEETEKAFVPCHLVPGERMYHTGDLGRYNEEGQIEYLGRIDFQVKLRGFRIEPGEVESRAVQYAGIRQAVALVRNENLILYFTSDNPVEIEDLRVFMAASLTDYMVPDVFCQLDELPMTPSGKIDRNRLPDVLISEEEIIAPETEMEKQIYDVVCRFLSIDHIGVNTNLVSVGMTSLIAMRINAALSVELGTSLRVADIIKYPVIRQLSKLVVEGKDDASDIVHYGERQYYPITENQRGIYIDWELNRETTQYNTPNVYVFTDKDPEGLAEAVEKTVDAHGYLKTRLAIRKEESDLSDQIVQEPHFEKCRVPVHKLEERPDAAFFQKLVRPFDLFEDSLYRIEVFEYLDECFLFIDIHHIIFDGLSNGLFLREVLAAYEGKDLFGETITAFDYALYEKDFLNSEAAVGVEAYFDDLVRGADQTVYPASKNPDVNDGEKKEPGNVRYAVKKSEIDAFCKENRVTPGSFLQAAFAETLMSFTRDEKPLYVTVSNGRGTSARLLSSMGMFVKTLPVVYPGKMENHGEESVVDYVKNMHDQLQSTYDREIYPYTYLVEKHKLHAQIMFAYQGGVYETGDLKMPGTMELSLDTAKLPVLITVYPEDESYVISVEYDGRRYGKADMMTLAEAVMNAAVSMSRCETMGQVEFLNPDQERKIKETGRGKEQALDPEETIVSIFRDRTRISPDAIALVFKDRAYSYRQIDEVSDRIALYLKREYHLGTGDIVGILIRRSEWMLIYPLAVMKTGAAYMPLDPDFPTDRLSLMCHDAGAGLVLSEEELPEIALPDYKGEIFKSAQAGDLPACSSEDRYLIAGPRQEDRLAVLYTSGSTGLPKGVELVHRGIVNYCHWYVEESRMTEDDHIAGYANFGFDAHMIDLYPTALAGATVYILDEEMRMDIFSMNRYMADNRITVAFLTTQIGCMIKDMDNSLRLLFTGGESMPALKTPAYSFYNVYGPTECSLFSTYYKINDRFEDNYIGRPLTNYQLYVADSCCRLLPEGVTGELLIAGTGLAMGYLNRPELTAEKFIDFEGSRAYRSGDLVRWTSDLIEYVGRNDNQVKLRGLRIELGEIEKKILDMDRILQAAVLVKGEETKRLVCYYVAKEEISPEDFREILSKNLAQYMIPELFILMPEFKLNANGKIDRKALPDPEIVKRAEYIAPETPLERKLAHAMGRILGIQGEISSQDSFYALGGDSIKAIRLVSLLREMGIQITVSDIMKEKTVKNIAAFAKEHDTKRLMISQEPEEGFVDDSAIISFYKDLDLPDAHHMVQTVVLKVQSPVDYEKLQKALNHVTFQHDMLRAVIKDGLLYIRGADVGIRLENYRASSVEEASEIFAEMRKNLDMSDALLRAALVRLGEEDFLCMVAHHLIIDGVSWRILTSDLERAYEMALQDRDISLPPKTSSYLSYARTIREYRNSYHLEREIPYWNKVWTRMCEMDTSRMKDYGRIFESKTLTLDQVHTSTLKQANRACLSLDFNDFLLTALARAYSQVMKTDEISISLEGHGREEFSDSLVLDRTVGWFTSIYPVIFDRIHGNSSKQESLQADLIHVKETLRRIPNKGAGFMILRYLEGMKETAWSKDITSLIGFNYLGETDAEQKAGGIFESAVNEAFQVNEEREHSYGSDLDINCAITGGLFTVNMAYNRERYDSEIIDRIGAAFFGEIEKLTHHLNFEHGKVLTASDFGEKEWTEEEFEKVYDRYKKQGQNISRIYPLLPMQEGMLFKHISEPESPAYHLVSIFELQMVPTEEMLKKTMVMLADKYEVLRTAFIYEDISAIRQVITDRELPFELLDFSGLEDSYGAICHLREDILNRSWNLTDEPLFKIICARIDDHRSYIMVVTHHLIVDGWSQQNYLADLFGSLLGKDISEDTSLNGLYEKYVRQILNFNKKAGLDYFKDLLAGYETKAQIPSDDWIPPEEQSAEDDLRLIIDKDTTDQFVSLCKGEKATVSNGVELVWGLILQTYSHTQDAVFGKVVSGRDKTDQDMSKVTGLFINSIPVRVKIDQSVTSRQMLVRLQQQAAASNEHDFCPLSEIQQQTSLGSDLLQTVIAYQNYNSGAEVSEADREGRKLIEPVLLREETFSGLNVTAAMTEAEELTLNIIFDKQHFRKEEILRVMELFRLLVEEIVKEPDLPASRLPKLSPGDTEKILALSQGEVMPVDENETWVDLFMAAASDSPDQLAVVDSEGTLSYGDLDRCSDAVVRELIENGVEPDSFVAVRMGRVREFVVGLLAVMKAGAAYVPIDPEYPEDRIRYMLDDSEAVLVLTQDYVRQAIKKHAGAGTINKAVRSGKAYMIYTSGSTGNPKGVVQSHNSLYHFVTWRTNKLGIKKGGNYGHFNSFAFDGSLDDLVCPLAVGAAVHIFSEDVRRDPAEMTAYIIDHYINGLTLSTQMGMELIRMKPELPLDYLMMGGEKLLPIPKTSYKVINGYGPTEFTVCSSYYVLKGDEAEIPIGRPVPNTASYVCDCFGNLIPRGIVGELYLAGPQMAECYWKMPELTNDTFVKRTIRGEQITTYKTGDLVKYNEEDQLEYAGRIDTQIKLRGYRVEFGEIEARALKHPLLSQAAANVCKDQLVLYYSLSPGANPGENTLDFENELHDFIAETITDYMVPTIYMRMEEIPFTPNGKIDRKALPEPELLKTEAYVEPENEYERLVAEGMREILELSGKVGALDKFYALGGDSIKVIRLINLLGTKGLKLKVSDFKTYQTVRKIAEVAAGRIMAGGQVRKPIEGDIADSAIIRFFKNLDMPEKETFTQDVFLGMAKPAKIRQLQKALDCLCRQHDLLRAVWKEDHLYVRDKETCIKLEEYALSDEMDSAGVLCEKIRKGIRMEKALFRAALIHGGDGDKLFMVAHHTIVDGISWRLLVSDLELAYSQALKGMKTVLPEKSSTYRDYVEALQNYRESDQLKGEIPYWDYVQKRVDDMPGSDMKDYSRTFGNVKLELDVAGTRQITGADAGKMNLDMNDLLITAVARAYCSMEKVGEVSIQLEGHGREDIAEDLALERTVGWFTSVFPVVIEDITNTDIKRDLIRVKETLHRIPVKGVGYNILRFMDGEEKISYSTDRIAKISFNYLGEIGGSGPADTCFFVERIDSQENEEKTEQLSRNVFGSDLNVNCLIENGMFVLMVSYNTACYEYDQAEAFAGTILDELKKEADFLSSLDEKIITAVDMGENVLTEERFEAIWQHFVNKGLSIEKIKNPDETEEAVIEKLINDLIVNSYECPGIYHVRYNPSQSQLDKVLSRLQNRYEVLRTAYAIKEGEPARVIVTDKSLHASMVTLSDDEDAGQYLVKLRDELQAAKVDMMDDDLLKIFCVPGKEGDCYLLIAIHPMVSACSQLSDLLMAAKCLAYLAEEADTNFRIDDILRDKPLQAIYRDGIRICGLDNEYDPERPTFIFPCGIILQKSIAHLVDAWNENYNVVEYDTINLHFHQLFDGETYDDIVNYYMTLLEFMVPQPNKIFCCIGYSFGGEIAYSMAGRIEKDRDCQPIVFLGDSDLIPCLGSSFERDVSKKDLDPMLIKSLNKHEIPQESMVFAYNMLSYLNVRKKTVNPYNGKTVLLLALINTAPQTIALRKQLASAVARNLSIIEFPDRDHFTLHTDPEMAQIYSEMLDKYVRGEKI